MSFANVTTGLNIENINGTQIFSIDHSGTGLTTPFFTYKQRKDNIQMSLDIINLRLGTGGSVIDISTDVNDFAPITIDRVTTLTGNLFKQTTVSEVAITAVADASIANGTITAMADNGTGGTTISTTTTYFEGEKVQQMFTTSYDGIFRIFNVVAGVSYDIETPFVADDAAGTIITKRIALTVGASHGIVAGNSIKVKDALFYNAFYTVLIAGATLITINGNFIATSTTGNIERDVGLDHTDPRVKGFNNGQDPDSMIIAEAHFLSTTATQVTINTVGVAEKIGTTLWIGDEYERAVISNTGVVTYKGTKDKRIITNFSATIERVTGTPTLGIGVGLFKNGVLIGDFIYVRSFNAGFVQVTGNRVVDMIEGNNMEIVVINFDNAVNINVKQADLIWNSIA